MNIFKSRIAAGKVVLAASVLLMLTACKQDFTLLDADNAMARNDTLEVRASSHRRPMLR